MNTRLSRVLGGLLVIVTAVLLSAQPIYNPSALHFDHTDYGITDAYRLQVYRDGTDYTGPPLYAADIPKAKAIPSGTGYELRFFDMPLLPVGQSYRASLRAIGTGGTSEPSNVTPELWRINACARPGSSGVTLPSMSVQTWPTMKVGQSTVLTLALRAPGNVVFLMLDLLADQQPASYYVAQVAPDTPASVQVFWGPFSRAGRFEVAGQMIDAGGCQATLPAGFGITIAP